ncbi:MAG: PVC-type heme-binding CxxCH protein [Agriterribacter sp.]
MTQLSGLLPVLFVFIVVVGCDDSTKDAAKKYPDGKSVQDELKSFHVATGFTVENVAAEPEVMMPVSMAIDEDGNTYVVQMTDYPFVADSLNGKCSIKVLFDNNNDGKYDSSTVFINKVPDITAVLPYKQGLLVAAAPYIFHMKDTNNDFMVDKIDTLFSGFFIGNSEAQITNLTYGLDNWIYANNHGQAGQVKFWTKPNVPSVTMGGHDFRFRLDKGLFEAESGTGQFGLAMNDFNHRFYTQNTLHIQTNPIALRYLKRHTLLTSYRADRNISDHELEMFQLTEAPYWRRVRSERRQHQYDSLKMNRTEWIDKHFTGASGATFYGGDGFPAEYYGSIFTGEVAGNLVHRDVLVRGENDITYTATRGSGEKSNEFLASTDMWFRPTTFYSGPDGNLFMVDMYRQHIETPVSIPEDLKEDMDFSAGNDMGRIFLIKATGWNKKNTQKPQMSKRTTSELVAYLAHPNAWWRTTAQRVIVERQDKTVVTAVRSLYQSKASAATKLRSLYALEGLGALTIADVQAALADKDANVREHGIMLAERFSSLNNEVAKLINDPAKFVAFQAVLSVGNAVQSVAIPALAEALTKNSNDSLFTIAVLTSKPGVGTDLLPALLKDGYFSADGKFKTAYLESISYAVGLQDHTGSLNKLYTFLSGSEIKSNITWIKAAATGLSKGIKASKTEKHSAEFITLLNKIVLLTNDDSVKKLLSL